MDNTPQIQNVYNYDPLNIQTVSYTSSAAETTNPVSCEQVLLIASSDCHVLFGSDPTALTTSMLLPAKTFLALACQPTDIVSAIEDSASGTLWVIGLR
jgi:hypothetical protein